MHGTGVVVATLVAYKLILLGIGLYASKRSGDSSQFLLAGRGLGPWVAALSASASSSSVWTLVGVSGYAYAFGLSAVWIFPACVGGFALNWFVVAPRLREASAEGGQLTLTEFLVAGEGSAEQVRRNARLASVIVVVCLGAYVAAQFRGAALAFQDTFEMDFGASLGLGAGIVILYTLMGGFWAVSLTDTLQGLVMAGAAVALPLAGLVAVGGPMELFGALQRDGGAALLKEPGLAGLWAAAGLLGIGLGYPGQPHVVNRLMALRDEGAARRARWISIGWASLTYAGMLCLGWCGRVLWPALEDREALFVHASQELFPGVVAGILLAALLSAIMSTADSQLLVASSAMSHDWDGYEGRSVEHSAARSRVFVIVVGGLAVMIAALGSESIFASVLFAWSVMGAAFGPLLLLRLRSGRPRLDARSTLVTMTAGAFCALAAHQHPATKGGAAEMALPFFVALALGAWLSRGGKR